MPLNYPINGVIYPFPIYGDTGWAQGAGNLTQILIALANGVGGSGANLMNVSTTSVSPTSVVSGVTYLVDTSAGAITLNLQAAALNYWFFVKDKKGTSVTNNITLHRAGTELIDGVASDATLAAPFGSWGFFSDGTDFYQLMNAV